MIIKSYRYRIYPTQEQSEKIDRNIGVCRLVYNLALEVKATAYQTARINLSVYDIQKQLVDLRREYEWIGTTESDALNYSVACVGKAFDKFFKGGGYPKYKNKRSARKSYRTKGIKNYLDFDKSTITLPKIKDIPIVLSRKFTGRIIAVTVSKTSTDKYFVSLTVETTGVIPEKPTIKNGVGVDLGLTTFATLSTGEKISNPKFLAASLKRLKVLQRRASNKKKGGVNRKKAYKKVYALHERIANKRNDFLNKVSTKLIRDNQTDTICLETLAVKNMVKNHSLAQAIVDVSWSEFVRQLEYKGKWYGKNIIRIDRFFGSSKTCSNCGNQKDQLDLSERIWECANCGSVHDRDINAAINIRNSGMGSPGEPLELPTIVGAKKKESMSIRRYLDI